MSTQAIERKSESFLLYTNEAGAGGFIADLRARARKCRRNSLIHLVFAVTVLLAGSFAILILLPKISGRDEAAASRLNEAAVPDRAEQLKKVETLALLNANLNSRMSDRKIQIENGQAELKAAERDLAEAQQRLGGFDETKERQSVRAQFENNLQALRGKLEQTQKSAATYEDQLMELQKSRGERNNPDIQQRIENATSGMVAARTDIPKLQSDIRSAQQELQSGAQIDAQISQRRQALTEAVNGARSRFEKVQTTLNIATGSLDETTKQLDTSLSAWAQAQAALEKSLDQPVVTAVLTATVSAILGAIVLLFIAAHFMSASRYHLRLAAFYDSRADAIRLLTFIDSPYKGQQSLPELLQLCTFEPNADMPRSAGTVSRSSSGQQQG